MHAQDLMTSPTITIHVNDPLSLAAHRMWEADIGALPVVNDEGKLVGMITDRDICMATYTQGRAPDWLLVNCAMAKHPISARPEHNVGDVEQLMSKFQVHRIPVVDAAGKPIGMISMSDLAIESVQPDTSMKHGPSKIAHTLAAISRPRIEKSKAA